MWSAILAVLLGSNCIGIVMFQLWQPGKGGRGIVAAQWFPGFSQSNYFSCNICIWSDYLPLKNIFQSSPLCGITSFDMKNACAAVCTYVLFMCWTSCCISFGKAELIPLFSPFLLNCLALCATSLSLSQSEAACEEYLSLSWASRLFSLIIMRCHVS